jgi:hypothetical protein
LFGGGQVRPQSAQQINPIASFSRIVLDGLCTAEFFFL